MPSDLIVNHTAVLGRPPPAVAEHNAKLMKIQQSIPKWWEVGAAEYRRMREAGETPLPKPILLPEFADEPWPSRDAGRTINCRVVKPDAGIGAHKPTGVYLHIHGGGWVLQSERAQDPFLKQLCNGTGLVVVSVGYRLAPEHPFPAGPNDCYDVAERLVDEAETRFGVPLKFVGGESAGGHLAALAVLHLLETRPSFRFCGTVLNYGCFNLSTRIPSETQFDLPLVLTQDVVVKYLEAFLPPPYHTAEARADPKVSPFFAKLFYIDKETQEGRAREGLPPALFVCGSLDPLLDDTVCMAARWGLTGVDTETRIWRGVPHGFNLFHKDLLPEAADCMESTCAWIRRRL